MIDLHSHLLPGLDDGSRSVQQSVRALELMQNDGVLAVALTPHLRASRIPAQGVDALQSRQAAFTLLAPRAPDGISLHLGFEVMLDEPLPPALFGDRRFNLGGTRYILVEFPPAVAVGYAAIVLQQIVDAGWVPIVAHPERYHACRPDIMQDWHGVGARIQVDATALTRPTTQGRRARALLAQGLADIVAADNHGDGRSLAVARDFLTEAGHIAAALTLMSRNPGAVLADEVLEPVPPVKLKEGIWARLRGMWG